MTQATQLAVAKYIASIADLALRQGEIISGLKVHRVSLATLYNADGGEIQPESHDYAIVVSQDCDLDWDFKARRQPDTILKPELNENEAAIAQRLQNKMMPNVLFCRLQSATSLKECDKVITKGKEINSDGWNTIESNRFDRYHFLEKPKDGQSLQQVALPELAADFKRYFTMPTDEVYEQLNHDAKRHCRLASPYLEHFSTRFCYYQFRVALPGDHTSEPNVKQ